MKLFQALESRIVGQGVSSQHDHSNPIVPLYLKRESLVERIVPSLNVVVALKALLS